MTSSSQQFQDPIAFTPMNVLDPITVAQQLVRIESETSHSNAAVTDATSHILKQLEFEVEQHPYTDLNGFEKVCLTARRASTRASSPNLQRSSRSNSVGYFCHNDVVSIEGWNCPHGGPWDAAIADDRLWGRGACDMKGSTASALAALSQIDPASQHAPVFFFVTGDEESGMAGAKLVARSQHFNELVQTQGVGIIGEPTELQVVNSHKGACHFVVSAHGTAAHSSTIEGDNANWKLIPFLTYLEKIARRCETDSEIQNPAFTPPTLSINIVIANEPAMTNITVADAVCRIFLRPMPDTPWQELVDEVVAEATRMGLTTSPVHPLYPRHTPADRPCIQQALAICNQSQPLSVSYATDGCCFQTLNDMLVIGPGSIEQAHRSDEWISLEQLNLGTDVFTRLFRKFACSN